MDNIHHSELCLRLFIKNKDGLLLTCKPSGLLYSLNLPTLKLKRNELGLIMQEDISTLVARMMSTVIGENVVYTLNEKIVADISLTIPKCNNLLDSDVHIRSLFFEVEYHSGQIFEKDRNDHIFQWERLTTDTIAAFPDDDVQEGLAEYLINTIPSTKKKKWLFWVTTRDGDEDWFIISPSARSARSFHEWGEGYELGISKAKQICLVEKEYSTERTYHAQLWMLKDLGFEIVSRSSQRIVRKDGVIYKEGSIVDSVLFGQEKAGPGLYMIRTVNTSKFKIGATKNLKERIRNMQTGSPDIFEVYELYNTPKYYELERFLHKKYKLKNIGGEWFDLTYSDLQQIRKDVQEIIKEKDISQDPALVSSSLTYLHSSASPSGS